MIKLFIFGLSFYFLLPSPAYSISATSITPNEVYSEILRIHRETLLIARHLGITVSAPVPFIEANLLPRHNWAQAFTVLTKIVIFKHQRGMIVDPPTTIEPYRDLDLFYTWGQAQRILAEIAIVKKWLDITEQIEPIAPVSGKRQIDIFNYLRQISAEWNLLLGAGILPNHVYGDVIHLIEEVRALLIYLDIIDSAAPPPRKNDALPRDSLEAAFAVLAEVQRIQTRLRIAPVDFSPFQKIENVVPDDVLTMVNLIIGEIQVIKAHLGLRQNITPQLYFSYQNKKPADVQQILSYTANRLRLMQIIRTLDK